MLKIDRMIIDWQFYNLRCFFCNNKQSVKYIVNYDGCKVPCCNKCIITEKEKAEMEKLHMYQVVVKIDNGMVVTDKCLNVFAVSAAVAEKTVKDHYNSKPHTKVHYCKDVTEIPIKNGMLFNMNPIY